MDKKRKIYFFDFIDILQNNSNSYHSFLSRKYYNKTKNITYYGTAYILDKPIEKKLFLNYSNVSFGKIKHEYAPELSYNVIIIWENSLKTILEGIEEMEE